MASSSSQLDFGLTYPAVTTGWPSTATLRRLRGLVSSIGKFEVLSYPAGKVFCRTLLAPSAEERMPTGELQECLWQDFFGDPTLWWDNRRRKGIPQISEADPAWLNHLRRPSSVGLQLAALDLGMKAPPVSVSTTLQADDAIESKGATFIPISSILS